MFPAFSFFFSFHYTDTTMERNTLMAKCYPRIKDYCREKHGLEFQVITKCNEKKNLNFVARKKVSRKTKIYNVPCVLKSNKNLNLDLHIYKIIELYEYFIYRYLYMYAYIRTEENNKTIRACR